MNFFHYNIAVAYIQALHQQKILITEQQISDVNPLFELAKVTNTLRLKP